MLFNNTCACQDQRMQLKYQAFRMSGCQITEHLLYFMIQQDLNMYMKTSTTQSGPQCPKPVTLLHKRAQVYVFSITTFNTRTAPTTS